MQLIEKSKVFALVGAITMIASCVVMAGWLFDMPLLTRVWPGLPTMKFNTAICLFLSGAATALVYYTDRPSVRYVYYSLSAIILSITALTLAEYFWQCQLGIDHLFVRDQYSHTESTIHPGRMAEATAVAIFLLAIGLSGIISGRPIVRRLTQYALHLTTLITVIALIGYIIDVPNLYKLYYYSSMAVNTSVLLVLLSVTLSFYHSALGVTGIFTGRGVGNDMARKLFPPIAIATMLEGYFRLLTHRHHLVSVEFGIALLVTSFLLVTLVIVWLTAAELNKLENKKAIVESSLFDLRVSHEASRRAAKEIEDLNKRNQVFVEQAPSAIAMFDTDMRYLAASEQWRRDYKLEDIQLVGRSHYEIFPEIGDDWKAIHQACLRGAINQCDEAYFIRADGSEQWIAWDVRPWFRADQTVGGLLMYTADISTLKKNESLLREIGENLAVAQEIAQVGSWEWNIETGTERWSDEQFRIFGYEPGEVQATYDLFVKSIHPDDQQKVLEAVNSAFKGTKPYAIDFRIVRRDGSLRYIDAHGKIHRDAAGRPVRLVGTVADITDRKKTEENLKRLNSELTSIFNTETHVSIIGTDIEGTITHFNRGAEVMLGYRSEEIIGIHTPALIHDSAEVKARGIKLSEQYQKEISGFNVFVTFSERGNFESREWTYVRKDGTRFPVQVVVSTIRDEHGQIKGYLGIATDISERKEAEETRKNIAVLRSRNKEMEEFSYIASHDLQEPLRTVTSFVDLLHQNYENRLDAEGKEYLSYIYQSTTRMSELIKGLLDFSRLGKHKTFELIDCGQIVQYAIDDLHAAIAESHAKVTYAQLPVINALPSEMQQLFLNLIGNAIKFRKKDVAPVIHISAQQIEGFWEFKVRDNGIGIQAKNAAKIFILFQRLHNRDQYSGTGIGLSYCKKIVELHQGTIRVESVPGQGSDFFFTISSHLK